VCRSFTLQLSREVNSDHFVSCHVYSHNVCFMAAFYVPLTSADRSQRFLFLCFPRESPQDFSIFLLRSSIFIAYNYAIILGEKYYKTLHYVIFSSFVFFSLFRYRCSFLYSFLVRLSNLFCSFLVKYQVSHPFKTTVLLHMKKRQALCADVKQVITLGSRNQG